MKIGYWVFALALLVVDAAWAGVPAPAGEAFDEGPSVGVSSTMGDFQRNAALGATLSLRSGMPEEYEEVKTLAERGLAAARGAVDDDPESAEARYVLGSWLLYGYRVVEVRRITIDSRQGERTATEPQVVMGLLEDPEEGLGALVAATELEPENGTYVLDYAAALIDCGRPARATGVLKGVWAGEPELTGEEKMWAALLLSDIQAYEGRLQEAREWIYAALSLDATAARAVERLRHLDAAEAAAEAAEAAEDAVWVEEAQSEEGWVESETGEGSESEE